MNISVRSLFRNLQWTMCLNFKEERCKRNNYIADEARKYCTYTVWELAQFEYLNVLSYTFAIRLCMVWAKICFVRKVVCCRYEITIDKQFIYSKFLEALNRLSPGRVFNY